MLKNTLYFLTRDKTLVGLVATGLLTVGCVGIFASDSDVGSSAAIIAGAVMFTLATLVDRILMIKYGPYEIHLARDYLEAAQVADLEGDEPAADALRDRGLDLLRQAQESQITYSAAIRRLYGMARGHIEQAIRSALETEGLQVEPTGLQSLLTYFSLVGRRGEDLVGIIISFGEWEFQSAIHKIQLSIQTTPGLKGVLVVQNMMTLRRGGGALPHPSVEDIERSVENQLPVKIKVRVVSWRQGDPIDDIRQAVRHILN